ncbi:MAG: DNA primase [Anaerolineae bacterium]|nr:DNA primase [Anaerolineae bacterium]MDW8098389.1 DNA primase [Anaerolineae bacterium]
MELLTAMNAVEEIKQRLDIVEVISTYVPLKRAGRHFKGLCPFHTERTPSFIVFPETGTWHCFGACGTGGDIFTFIMRRENLDFHEALQLLARRAGVELMPAQPREAEAERRNERLRAICSAAAAYYHRLLLEHPQAVKARDHLAQRGIHEQTIRTFQLGYALDDWEAGQRYLLDLGYALADIVQAGLAVERQGGGGYYDRFRGRLIIPICDVQGRVVGFGARALDDALPKYLNSPQTPIFDKGHILFGLDKARQAIRAADLAVIVEGYMDVITAHQYGYANVVASMGTALTEPQLRQLKRYTRNFTLALDPDAAGQQATLRGLEQARQALDREIVPVLTPAGLVRYERRLEAELRILSLPGAQDPDEVIRSDPQRWPELVEQALPIVDFYLARALETHDLNSAHGKAAIVAEIVPLIRELADDVMRHHYIQLLARRVQVDERIIERQLARRGNERADVPRPSISVEPAWRIGLEDYCLARILAQPEVLPLATAELAQASLAPLDVNDYERAENREIFARLQVAGDSPDMAVFAEQIPAVLQPHWAKLTEAIARMPTSSPEQAARDLVNAILSLRVARIRRSLDELQRLLAEAQAAGDLEAARAYAQMVHTRTQERKRLDAIRHRRTMVGKRT